MLASLGVGDGTLRVCSGQPLFAHAHAHDHAHDHDHDHDHDQEHERNGGG